jgi:hypothetical protein
MKKLLLLTAFFIPVSFATAEELPLPPIPPEHPPAADAAPIPNVNARAPVTPTSSKPSVNVTMYRAPMYDPGVGFTPGSRYQSSEDRKPIQTPGFSVSVPIE